MTYMPVAEKPSTAEAAAYQALLKHAKTCKICRARGRDLCKTYVRLFLKWDALQRNQT